MACDVPGRDVDLVRLIDTYAAIAHGAGGGQTVFVAGDEGSGRTALLRALPAELERVDPKPIVLAGSFRDGRFVAWSEAHVPIATAVDVVTNVVELAEALIPYAALVGQVLSKGQAAVDLVRRLIGASERLRPTEFLPQLLRELCTQGPVVCLIDDADRGPAGLWGDLVLGLAGRIAAELRLLLVLAIDGPMHLGAGAIQLGEHDDDEPETLYVARKLTGRGIADWHPLERVTRRELERWTGPAASGLLQRLLDVTGGRAAWAAQLWNHWQANDVVQSPSGSPYWQFAADGYQRALDPVDDVLERRLRQLVGNDARALDRARELLVCAALEGRRFTTDAVAGALGRDQDQVAGLIDSKLALNDQQQNRLVLQAGSVSVDDKTGKRHLSLYRFQAELAWLTLGRYHGLSDDERRKLAEKLANTLRTLYGREAHRVAGVLARLFEIAADPDAAHHFQRMADAGVNRAIIVWRARQVLVAAEPRDRADRRRASQILLRAADALLDSGPFPEGLRFAEAAQRLAPLERDYATALYLTGVHRWRLGDHEQARNELTRVLGLYDWLADRRGEASARLALAAINADHAAYDDGPPPTDPRAYRDVQRTLDCPQPPDDTLLEQARAGDDAAFAIVYDRHAAAAYGLARHMLHSRRVAEDVVQEAFLSLWRTDRYRSEQGDLRNLVLTIVRNRAIDVLRQDRSHRAQERRNDTAAWSLMAAAADDEVQEGVTQRRLRAALSTLPDAQRHALELAFLGGMTHTEIALRLNEPIRTIKVTIRLGLEQLRAELNATSCR